MQMTSDINNRAEWCNLATDLYQPGKSVPVIGHFSHKFEVLTSKHYIWPDMLTRLSCYNVKHIYMCIYIYIWWQEEGCSHASINTVIRNELLEAQMFVIGLIFQTFCLLELRQWMTIMNTRVAYVQNLTSTIVEWQGSI